MNLETEIRNGYTIPSEMKKVYACSLDVSGKL